MPAEARGENAGDHRTGADGTADAKPALINPHADHVFQNEAKADAFVKKNGIDRNHFDVVQTGPDQWKIQPYDGPHTEFRPADVEGPSRKKIPGLSASFDNGRGSRGVMDLAMRDGRLYPAWVDAGLSNGSTGGKVRAMYERAIDEAEKRGLRFTSDDSVTVDAARIYDALAKRGYDVVKNPDAKLVEPPDVLTARWRTDDGSPVYTVKKEIADVPERPQVPEEAPTARGEKAAAPAVSADPESEGARAPAVKAISGSKIDGDWATFAKHSGSLNIPRADMPQVRAEHRGALVNFLAARGIEHQQEEVPAASLKPTQREFSPAKVDKAAAHEGGDRSILVSSDGHVLDGHHQWLAKLADDAPVNVIRLNAPIKDLLDQVKEFPSAEAAAGASSVKPDGKLAQRRALNAKQDEVVRAAAEKLAARKAEKEQAAPQPAAAEAPAPTPEPTRDVPRSFMKKVKVDHEVYIKDERRWETVKVPADKALASVREDISNLEALLKCMKG